MRKVYAWAVLAVICGILSGCGSKEKKTEINITGPDGKGVKVEVNH